MRLRDIVLAEKQNVKWTQWKNGKMPKSAFPLNKNRSFRIRGKWRWCLCTFLCLGHSMRVLVAYRSDIEEYLAMLGIDLPDSNTRVLARFEFHGSHPPWHVHSFCEDVSSFLPRNDGRSGYPDMQRIPGGNASIGNNSFHIHFDRSATDLATRKFGLGNITTDAGLFQ